jgi:hypothetical protein
MASLLFAYGTLRDPDLLIGVLGRRAVGLPAAAPGFAVVHYPGRIYPALLRRPGAAAPGLVLTDLTPFEVDLLDAFEGAKQTPAMRYAPAARVAAGIVASLVQAAHMDGMGVPGKSDGRILPEEAKADGNPVVKGLVDMSYELGTRIIAEGVEREEERAVLCDLGVTLAQGWLFGKPHEVVG